MAANDHNEPIITAGPIVDGEESIVILFSSTQLESYPQMDAVVDLINKGFAKTHQPIWGGDGKRFESPRDAINHLLPYFLTYIVSSKNLGPSGRPKVHATASARKLVEHTDKDDQAETNGFERSLQELPQDVDFWELKLLVVDVSLHKTGLASLLQGLLEAEVRKRSIEAQLEETVVQSNKSVTWPANEDSKPIKEIRLTLTTCQEVNEAYYLRKGYKTTKLKSFPAGYLDSLLPFHIAEMEKTL